MLEMNVDYSTNKINLKARLSGENLPSFMQGHEVSISADLTAENLLEAHEYMEKQQSEEIERLGESLEDPDQE